MKKEYIIERQGKQFVLYEGLLDEAHQQGLCRISTTLIQVPHPDNGNVAIVAAEVETSKGSFSGIGDASPTNVGRPIIPHIVRMAETRAKARAMRDAVNIGVAALEELGGDDEPAAPRQHSERRDEPPAANARPPHEEPPRENGGEATAAQLETIGKLRRLLGQPEGDKPRSKEEAGALITRLSGEYNEQRRAK